MMEDRGSFTVELSVMILAVFFVVLSFISLTSLAYKGLYEPGSQAHSYEEAFLKKIENLRHEKVLREER